MPVEILPPRGTKDLSKLSARRQAEVGFAAMSPEFHWKRAGYSPHPKQVIFHTLIDDPAYRYVAYVAGVGSGKTRSGAAEAVRQAISQPGSIGIVAAPTYKMLASSTEPQLFAHLHEDAIHKYDKTDKHIFLTNGSEIWLRSTEDPDSYRGIDATWFWLDEGAYTLGGAWNTLVGRLRQPGYRHCGWVTTTPRGMNWVWDRFAAPSHTPHYGMVQATSRDNPYLSQAYIDDLNATYGGAFREQEVEGRFMGFEGLVYPAFSRDLHIGRFRLDEKFRATTIREVFYAHDWGFTNPMVVLACGVDGDGRLYILDEFYEKGATIGDVASVCSRFESTYGPGPHIVDPSEPGLIQDLAVRGFHMVGADNTIMEGINRLSARLDPAGDGRPRLFVDESCTNTIMEFGNYRWEESKEGRPIKEKPVKVFDHAMDSARYICNYLEQGSSAWGAPVDGSGLFRNPQEDDAPFIARR